MAAALAIAVGAAACSGDQASDAPPRHPVAAAIAKLQEAFGAGDAESICRRMTRPAQIQAGEVAHGDPTSCGRDLRRAFQIIADGGGWGQGQQPVVTGIARRGSRATTTIEQGGRWRATVPLSKEGGAWQLAGFFGMRPRDFERIVRTTRAQPFPDVDGEPVSVVDGQGAACGAVSDKRHPVISGGCSFEVSIASVPIRMLTPFGDFKFSDCSVSYRVFVDGEGRTWSSEWQFEHEDQRGCSDINQCYVQRIGALPWKGRLVGDGRGGYLHHMDMCLKTCIGLFAGDFVMRLARHDKGWRVATSDRGATGFKIDGELAVKGDAFDIRG